MNRQVLVGAVAALLALTGCGGGSDTSAGAGGEPPEEGASGARTVVIKDIDFKPDTIRVKAGDTVVWRFEDKGIKHNVVADDGSFESETTDSGTFEHTFERPGTYPYVCTLHAAQMKAEVEVT